MATIRRQRPRKSEQLEPHLALIKAVYDGAVQDAAGRTIASETQRREAALFIRYMKGEDDDGE